MSFSLLCIASSLASTVRHLSLAHALSSLLIRHSHLGKPSPWVNQAPCLLLTCTEASGCVCRKTQSHVVSCHSPYVTLTSAGSLGPPATFCSAHSHSNNYCSVPCLSPDLCCLAPCSLLAGSPSSYFTEIRSKRKRMFSCTRPTCSQL